MLVEKLICNARLNLLILHPRPTPSQLSWQTEEPSGLSVPRCQEIKISIRKWRSGGVGRKRGSASVGLTHQRGAARLPAEGYRMSSLASPPPSPVLLCKALSTCIIRPFISRQTKHVLPGPHQPDTAHTSIHRQKRPADKVKLAEGRERAKGRQGGIC